ncbi:MAG: primosomal protein N' [Chloroflexi bacterium]|nr:primosomal protein N' [Chloroflexota bacterium]
MSYAEVSVNSPVGQRMTFSYTIPPGLPVEIGHAVWVPFGEKLLQGVVLQLTEKPTVEETREIAGIIDSRPVLSPQHVLLARWLSDYYLSPIFDAVAPMLPPGFERRALTFISIAPSASEQDISPLNRQDKEAFELVRKRGRIGLAELEKAFGQRKAKALVSRLVKKGFFVRSYEMEPIKVKPKKETYLGMAIESAAALSATESLRKKRAFKQADLLDFLAQKQAPVAWSEARQALNCTRTAADALISKGLVSVREVEVTREPISYTDIISSQPLTLTRAQQLAFEAIQSSLREGVASPSVFLLHGVTGSGKTEIYLQSLAEAVKLGKRGIVLVPEIALTPQTIERYASRFPKRVAVLHSQLSLGEQFDEWQRIRNGEFDVVIGSRSAIFAPQPDLGLIVIDEEHEWTYKQQDKSPHYHARSAAIKLAELTGATVVLGSATPDLETFYRAQRGDYRLLQLSERVVPTEGSALPHVQVVDLREELKAGNRSIFSRALSQATSRALAGGEQVIFFLNRRGGASSVQCRSCGAVFRCRRCDIPLVQHPDREALVCHQCNYRTPVPRICPQCRSPRIKFLGIGTQKVEQEAGSAFPQARLLRWDRDVTQGRRSHDELLGKFRAHKADILIGTQMIAKGLDLPLVTLVGVIIADTGLNLPDFRAGERTFHLLCQGAGRAGRGTLGGQVFVQTYSPEHYAVQAAAGHDYALFYQKELAYRRELHNPPFSRLARLVYSHTNDTCCQQEAERMKRLLSAERDSKGIADITLIGPAPAFIHRLRGKFRWQLVLRGSGLSDFLSEVRVPQKPSKTIFQGWTVDIDPVGLA